jgi:hypothetical protein
LSPEERAPKLAECKNRIKSLLCPENHLSQDSPVNGLQARFWLKKILIYPFILHLII